MQDCKLGISKQLCIKSFFGVCPCVRGQEAGESLPKSDFYQPARWLDGLAAVIELSNLSIWVCVGGAGVKIRDFTSFGTEIDENQGLALRPPSQ